MAILSEQDWTFWHENGYVVIHDAVPKENLEAVVESIWQFTGKNPNDPETWPGEPLDKYGIISMWHDQPLWDNRQWPRVYKAFSELFDTTNLWVCDDRVSMNPPVGPNWPAKGWIHFDLAPVVRPLPLRLQGVLNLTDTGSDMGGFHCEPGFHKRFDEWEKTHPMEKIAGRNMDPTEWNSQPVPAKAGDLIIWISTLPHGIGINRSRQLRLAQYITMAPIEQIETNIAFSMIPKDPQLRLQAIERYPYQNIVANVLGIPAGYVESWISRARHNQHKIHEKMPAPRFAPKLTPSQLAALADRLARPPVPTSISFDPSHHTDGQNGTWDAHGIATLMEREFDLSLDIKPIVLTDLGRKLIGIQSWG